jgi:hypothetical protein
VACQCQVLFIAKPTAWLNFLAAVDGVSGLKPPLIVIAYAGTEVPASSRGSETVDEAECGLAEILGLLEDVGPNVVSFQADG